MKTLSESMAVLTQLNDRLLAEINHELGTYVEEIAMDAIAVESCSNPKKQLILK